MNAEYRAPRNRDELEDTIECSAVAFGGGDWVRNLFINITKHDPWFCLENTRACFLDGSPVSVVQIFDRPMRIGDCVVRLGGVGSVGTLPEHRRSGHSLAVLRDAARYMEAEGYDLSFLGTGVPAHYARAGWVQHPTYSYEVELGTELKGTSPDAAPGEQVASVAVEPFDPERHLGEVIAIFEAFNRARTGTLVRTGEYWRRLPRWRPYDLKRCWVARSESRLQAYLFATEPDVVEFGCHPGDEGALAGLVRHALAAAASAGKERLSARIPTECRSLFEILGCSLSRRESSAWMGRLVNPESLLGKLTALFWRRLCASSRAGWQGTIRIDTETGELGLRISGDGVSVGTAEGDPDVGLRASQYQLLHLLLGGVTGDQLSFCNSLDLSDDAVALTDVLFPPDQLYLWDRDGF